VLQQMNEEGERQHTHMTSTKTINIKKKKSSVYSSCAGS
jgi:hypothetical protein